ncbi:MAG TPA: nucleotidyltransferase family protein [Chryseosolibacter sp.]
MRNDDIGVLILAAGSSSRMGTSKQMLPVGGTSLLAKTISTALESKLENIVVVLGSNADEHRIAANEFPVTTLINLDWHKGMGTSIKVGVKHFQGEDAVKGVIILVCDQPKLSPDVIVSLIEKEKQTHKPIIASRYANTLGVPALFMRTMFDKLLTLQDDHGAKKIIVNNEDHVSEVDFPDGEIDLDTKEDYDNYIKNTNA